MAGRIGLTKADIERFDDNFLGDELAKRLALMPVEWRVLLQFPEDTDPLRNVTVAWPENRVTREVGRLQVNSLANVEQARQLEGHVFDPERLPTGIAPYGDPIFGVRSGAYAISEERRRLATATAA
jgi:catalase